MTILRSEGAGDPDLGFYNGVATQSLRCDSASNPKLVLDGTSGNRKTWTWSCWVKRSALGSAQIVFNVGVTGVDEIDFHFTANDEFIISDRGGHNLKTAQLFRDTSAWYNLVVVMDTEQSGVTFSSANALKLYVNGVRVTDYGSGTSLPDEDDEFSVNHTRIHHIATRNLGDNDFDGYIAEMNLVDGIAIGETNGYLDEFGEVKNGVWIPKKYTGAYGNNGFRLEFKETGTGTGASDTVGADTKPSGTKHHFTSSGIVASDCNMPDSPENNFATLNHNARGTTNVALSEGALKFVCNTGNNFGNVLGTIPLFSGKWYCEGYMANTSLTQFGVQEVTNNIYQSSGDFGANTDLGMWDSRGYFYDEGTAGGTPSSFANGDIINIAFDVDAGKIWFGKNGTYLFSGDPANGTNQSTGSTNDLSPIGVTIAGNGASGSGIYNCGQDDTFAGNKTSGSANATDDNGIGQFYYAPPSGFLAICSANLSDDNIPISPAQTTQADDHFNAILYEGNGSPATHTLGFRPNMVWGKKRLVNAQNHWLINDVTDIDKFMSPDTEDAESTTAGTTFNATSFTTANNDLYVNNGSNYVVWAWKGNGTGTATSNTSGSINSTVSVNTDAGLSIVSYTGNGGGSSATVGHGLGVVPDMYIVKRRESGGTPNWAVYHKGVDDSVPQNYFMRLDTNVGRQASSTMWNNTAPTSSVFSIGTSNLSNNSQTFLALCFAEVEGYSRFGKYIGNGATSGTAGTFVYLGFRPKFVMLKLLGTGHWWILDSTRDPHNEALRALEADTNVIETGYSGNFLDFYSNGFAPRTSGSQVNGSGSGYIYMAFAENPFKYANAR